MKTIYQAGNETIYGLSAGIWTSNITRGASFCQSDQAGVIGSILQHVQCASPFGGYKQSGLAGKWASTRSRCTQT